MLEKIDFWFLGRLEKFANWWQKLTGKNCFSLARAFIVVYGISIVEFPVYQILKTEKISIFSYIVLVTLAFIAVIFFLRLIKFKEKIVLRANRCGLSNPFKLLDNQFRIFTLCFAPIFLCIDVLMFKEEAFILIIMSMISISKIFSALGLSYYFSACDPLPPSKSRVKEWKEKFVNAVKGIFAPAPRPSPAHCE